MPKIDVPASQNHHAHRGQLHHPQKLGNAARVKGKSQVQGDLSAPLLTLIEPNPSRKGFRPQYTYQSHSLRFSVIRPNQSFDNFRAPINRNANSEEYNGLEGDGRSSSYTAI